MVKWYIYTTYYKQLHSKCKVIKCNLPSQVIAKAISVQILNLTKSEIIEITE